MKDLQQPSNLNDALDDYTRITDLINKYITKRGLEPIDFTSDIKAKPLFNEDNFNKIEL